MSQNPAPSDRKQRRNPRNDFRARSHADAHSGEELKPQKIPDHPLISRQAAELVIDPDGLSEAVAHICSLGSFAYDSEFIGELSYFPKLCLIQLATTQRIILVDTLAGLELRELWEVMADPAVEKIVHAGEQDIEPIHREIGRPCANVFDTQIAAGFVGLAYPTGLSKLVRELIGVGLGKGFTFTHWDQRPLSPVQLRYAADDVRYLPALRAKIGEKLEALGHTRWSAEECAEECNPANHHVDPASDFLRIRGVGTMSPLQASVMKQLFIWRDEAARRYDLPTRSYLKDEILLDLARRPIRSVEDLSRVKHLPRPVEQQEGANILAATQRGVSTPEGERPVIQQSEESPTERFSTDAVWGLVQAWCHGHLIDPALVTSRNEVSRFVREWRPDAPPSSRLMRGWRNEFVGALLHRFLRGEAEIRLNWREGNLRGTTG
jgi:ribonuclease D